MTKIPMELVVQFSWELDSIVGMTTFIWNNIGAVDKIE